MTDRQQQSVPDDDERTRALLLRALDTIRRLEAERDAGPRASPEPVAIIGMAVRVPGLVAEPDGFRGSLDAYWSLLSEGRDAIGRVPPDRWDADAWFDPDPGTPGAVASREGGFLADPFGFDAPLFGMTPREALSTDPQHRLLLEVAWEALESAGQPPRALGARRVGVYAGLTTHDHGVRVARAPERIDPFSGAADMASAAAGRVSHVLGLTGPAIAIDAACASSLVAVHLALQGLAAGDCEIALAGGVNLILSPEASIHMSRVGALATDGRCRTFDAAASGIGRGEGAGIVVLKRLSDAVAAGDPIRAVIAGSAVNQDGGASGFSAPNPAAQADVIRRALLSSGFLGSSVGYVECHGTGTRLGDPIEVGALGGVFGGSVG
ncbi:MAG: polyketide synthase, partial [Pseudomonadota bacterium]